MKGLDVYHGDSLCEGKQLKAFCEAAYKSSDFVIVKATQGMSYKYTGWFKIMMKRCFKDGKLVGAYHYAAGNDPVKEADYFLQTVKPYLGKIILCLDWEGKQNSAFGSKTWCKKFIDRVFEKTGLTCVLYTGSDGCTQNKSLAGTGIPLWFAGYPKPMSMTWDVPSWKYNLGSWGSYPDIWQYTSSNEKCDRNTMKHDKKWWESLTKTSQEKEDSLRKQVVNNLTMLAGIKEGSKEHKMIIDTFNKSGLCPRYKMTTSASWCATAVSYAFIVAKLAGKPGSGSVCEFVECSCQEMIKKAKAQGVWKESDSYVPKPADVIMYDWQDTGKGDDTGWADHVGIVVSSDGKTIKVIEGNKNDAVGYRTVPVNGKTIRGFIVPKYGTGKKEEKSVPKDAKTIPKEEKSVPKPGSRTIFSVSKKTSPNTKPVTTGTVTASELNVRTWAGTENKTCSFSPLKKGTKVSICDSILSKEGTPWDYIKVNGHYGFVSSKYIK